MDNYIDDNRIKGYGSKESKKFMKGVFDNLIKEIRKYHKFVDNDNPLIYNEKQANSVLFPAINKFADASFMEQPLIRKKGRKEYTGWLDFWVLKEENVYLIEFKHSIENISTYSMTKDSKEKWKTAEKQLRKIINSNNYRMGKKLYKVIIHIIPVKKEFKSNKDDEFEKYLKKQISKNYLNKISTNLSHPKPNWKAFHNFKINLREYGNNEDIFEIYQGFLFFAHIELIKK